jgi:hypothetical protein
LSSGGRLVIYRFSPHNVVTIDDDKGIAAPTCGREAAPIRRAMAARANPQHAESGELANRTPPSP